MSISIGKKIKELRRSQDVTQEKLAEYLNISFQAVSRWENGLAYPDITLLPAIANFFGVSADELLGMRGNEDEKELLRYEEELQKLGKEGKVHDNIALCRKVLEKHPRNFKWMELLASELFYSYNATDDTKALEEAIILCERILEDCTDSKIRNSAVKTLCFSYKGVGNNKRALELAKQMPNVQFSQEVLCANMLKGKDEAVQRQSNLIMFIDFAQNELVYLSRIDSDLTTSGRTKCLETAIKLLEIICEGEENALFYNIRLSACYQQLARMYCGFYNSEDLDKNKAVEYLLCAERTGKRFDQCQSGEEQYYKSLFLNKEKFVPHNTIDGYVVNSSESLLHFIRLFDGFKNLNDHPEFIELMERLEGAV